jgi:hypothetical protein
MAAITRIDVRIKTGAFGTDGDVYLRIGGREFYPDSAADDFQPGSDRTYTLGEGANVKFAAGNDPRSPYQLRRENLDRFPVKIRFVTEQPGGLTIKVDDSWNIESVTVTVNPGPSQVQYQARGGSDNLTLGRHFGLYCDLVKL